mmetsp:Transcript_12786/g.32714  ORF Transcript_12786/g.32714 Transcript_12786/m.32714 type:complete len:647 (+) Transcript_12786:67-2007(+)
MQPFTDADVALLELLASIVSTLIARVDMAERTRREQCRAEAMLAVTTSLHSTLSVRSKALRAMQAAEHGTECMRASLLVVDAVAAELFMISRDESVGRRLPLNAGVAGLCATSGKMVHVRDAYTDERFDPSVDELRGVTTRDLLALPIRIGGRVVGVLLCVNQKSSGFDSTHEQLLALIAVQVAEALLPQLLEAIAAPVGQPEADLDAEQLKLRSWLISEYTTPQASSPSSSACASPHVSPGFFQVARGAAKGDLTLITRLVLDPPALDPATTHPRLKSLPNGLSLETLLSWRLNVWHYSNSQLLQLLAALFEASGVLETFQISHAALSAFLQSVAARYHPNPYHNLHHATQVVHVAVLLAREGIGTTRTPLGALDTLSLLIAALGHDVDHPGVSNAFLVATGSPLAVTYNDEAVLENHHAATTFRLLSNPAADVLSTLEVSQRRQLRKTVCKAILATDMARHTALTKELTEMAAERRTVDSSELVQTLLHLADLSNPVQHFTLSRRWAQCVCAEFRQQAAKERELGLPLTSHFTQLEGEEGMAKLQLGFIDVIAAPLWRTAALMLPGATARIDVLDSNRAAWQRLIQGDGTAEDLTTSDDDDDESPAKSNEPLSSHGRAEGAAGAQPGGGLEIAAARRLPRPTIQ